MTADFDEVHRLYDAEEIAARVDALAAAILARIGEDFVLLCVLNGGFMFASDLARAVSRRGCKPLVEFVTLKSYGNGMESQGAVRLIGPEPETLKGKTVLLVDDILDSGKTLAKALTLLDEIGAKSVVSCVLLDKPARRKATVEADLVGFNIEDVFVVGYGIDFADHYRHLPYLGYLEPA